jgi:hypothetical protein
MFHERSDLIVQNPFKTLKIILLNFGQVKSSQIVVHEKDII